MSAGSLSQSDMESRSPGRASSPPKDQEMADRQMIRHLLSRYTMKELERLLTEERRSLAALDDGHGNSRFARTQDDASDVPASAVPHAIQFSDSSSACGSISSSECTRADSFRGRKRKASASTDATNLSDESSWEAEDPAPVAVASKQKGSFTCGFCLEEGIKKTCTRKNDLKRHIEDFHHTDAQWFCRHRGCQMVFDWQTAYKAHLKSCHGGCRMNLYDAKVALCPQTVFACGFENCAQVFEATSDLDAPMVFREYVAHVVKHFDEGVNGSQWSYSARMRNLLRQSAVIDTFTQSMWLETDQNRLNWQTQSSSVLRKRLETRHLGDLQYLVQYAIALGSNSPGPLDGYRADLVTPVRSECAMALRHHAHAHAMTKTGTLTPEPDHNAMQYGLPSVDTGSALAAYYASQRQAYVPAPSAQPPMASAPYGFHDPQHQHPHSHPLPLPQPHQHQHQHQHQHSHHHQDDHGGMRQSYTMMSQSDKTEQQYMDLDLGNGSLLGGAEYASHAMPDLTGTYTSNGMSSPAPTEACAAPVTTGAGAESRPAYSVYATSPSFAFGMKMAQVIPA